MQGACIRAGPEIIRLIPDCEIIPRMAHISMDGKDIFLAFIPESLLLGCRFVRCTVK
jgi:hypothetical protein